MTLWLACAAMLAQQPGLDETSERAKVKRVYVDKFTSGDGSEQIRDLMVAALHRTKLFIVTENAERADAYLRGGGEDVVVQDEFQFRDNVDGRIQLGTPRTTTTTRSRSIGASVGEDDSQRMTERRHEAIAAVRLVNRDGDVIWSTTKESRGSKVKAASADLVERIVAQLVADFRPAATASAANKTN